MNLKMRDLFNILVFPFFVFLFGYALDVGVPAYQVLEWPNRFVHFLGGLSAAVAVYFVWGLVKRFKWIVVSSWLVDLALVLISVLAITCIWELYEFFMDTFFLTHSQPNVADTMKDMIMGALGAMAFCLGWATKILYKHIKLKKVDL